MKKNIFFVFAIFLLFSSPSSAFEGPLQLKNQFPLFLYVNAPYLESAATGNSFSAGLSHSSVFMTRNSAAWSVNLDMEITELNLRLRKVIPGLFEVGIEVPVMVTASGFMDGFLESYHKTFGFPDYGRDTRPTNSFLYEVRRNGAIVVQGRNGDIGIGDLRLTAKREIRRDDPAISVKADVELPAGSASDGHGSGSIDTGLSLLLDKKITERIISYWNAGVIFPGVLRAQEEVALRTSFYGGGAIEAALWDHFSLIGQIMFQTSPFPKTDIGPIDRIAALLSVGGRYSSGKNSLEFSLTEDPNTAGAPDVIFNLTYQRRF
ncbi:exported hypothetical protein [Candidatus Sulfobium mesophilum]|jgi:hypothetical protein|uniref:DUF3187 family protein n=1 Tax=Candidatus Sulfobium mesophilum TaxID=2016548 RepID=A0A2U3QJU2_9BACT|nr:exported hypothetical protein [Candidatus Sulfobium mesophilum]